MNYDYNFEMRHYLEVSTISLHYQVPHSRGIFLEDCEEIQEHMNFLNRYISQELKVNFGNNFYFNVTGYEPGSVRVTATLFAAYTFIAPILQGYITNNIPSIGSFYQSKPEHEYNRVCEKVQTITTEVIHHVEKHSNYRTKKIETTTRDIKDVCYEWQTKKF